MEKKSSAVKTLFRVLFIVLILVAVLPLALVVISRIGRIEGDSIIPDKFTVYVRINDPVQAANALISHKGLETLISDPALSAAAPLITSLREEGFLAHPAASLAGNGELNAALYDDGPFIAVWDSGFVSPLLRFLPTLAGRITVKDLYYVQAGIYSRFEFRPQDADVLYAGWNKNLLLFSNDKTLFESCLDGTSRDKDLAGSGPRDFALKGYHANLLADGQWLLTLADASGALAKLPVDALQAGGFAEIGLRIHEKSIEAEGVLKVSTTSESLLPLFERKSPVPQLLSALPEKTQYATLVAAGNLAQLLDAAGAFMGPELEATLKKADTSSRLLLGLTVDELLHSWTADEFAAFGLEGRPKPVFAVKVKDEKKRKDAFEKISSSLVVQTDNTTVLDGIRIPEIGLPDFLLSLLSLWKISIPKAYYIVENGTLFISESPENLVEVTQSIRKGKTLIRGDLWRALSAGKGDASAISLFYDLDRSIPFFLRGDGDVQRILQLYGQGIARISTDKGFLRFTLNALAGTSKGPVLVPGYPRETGGKAGKEILALRFPAKSETRFMYVQNAKTLVSFDPVNITSYAWESPEKIRMAQAKGLEASRALDNAVWTVTDSGTVALLNGNLELATGFPVATGVRLSAPPKAALGKLWLCDADGTFRSVNSAGIVETISLPSTDALRSPPEFFGPADKTLMTFYPKGFFAELWVTDTHGTVLSGWPQPVSGIAFGTPLPVARGGSWKIAFLTQAGELSLHEADGKSAPGFPVNLAGVFYLQSAFDGTYLWSLAEDGTLFRTALDGSTSSVKIESLRAETGYLALHDIDGDGIGEIFATGDGNAIHGYRNDLAPIPGFPLPAWGEPAFGDFNGDGKTECAAIGMDGQLYLWQFRGNAE